LYEPHQTAWFILSFFILFASAIVFLSINRKQKKISATIALAAMAQIFIAIGLQLYDNHQLRDELKQIDPLQVKILKILKDKNSIQSIHTAKKAELFSYLHAIENISAHHSEPINEFDLYFIFNGYEYHYKIGQDSERKDEYWVFNLCSKCQPDMEIGRIRSGKLEDFIEGLFTGKQL
jgi:hypothetical protein